MKKQLIGTCVGNPFKSLWKLNFILDNAKEITRQTFFRNCDVDNDTKIGMYEYPNDFEYYKSYEGVYFYTWSAIEHFYK